MFQLYITRIKILLREKSNLFWTLFFPIILATFFYLVLTDAYKTDTIDTINIAIVNQTEENSEEYTSFTAMMNDVEISTDKQMFSITYATEEEAKQLLSDDKITGYINYNKDLNLVVKSSGINESIIKSVLETYAKVTKTVTNLMVINGGTVNTEDITLLYDGTTYVVDANSSNKPPNLVLNHYYSLLAMACLFGGMYGLREVTDIQANLTSKGARLNASPTNKIKLALSSILAAFTIQVVSILLLIAFLIFVFKVDFGNKTLLIIVTAIIGSLNGVLFGTSIGSISKKDEDFKSSVLSAISMLGCFLAGLMVVSMKYIIATYLPFLQYINPANLITDAFYSLNFYESLDRFYVNIIILCIFNLILAVITFCATRRSEYASL